MYVCACVRLEGAYGGGVRTRGGTASHEQSRFLSYSKATERRDGAPTFFVLQTRQMEHGVVVTKYGKKGAAAQRVLYLDGASMSVAWHELDARSPGHRRSASFTNMIKGKREALPLAHLIEVGGSARPVQAAVLPRATIGLYSIC